MAEPVGNNEERAPRGFALLSPDRRAEIAKIGGKAAQSTGRAHRFTHEEVVRGGRAGGTKVSANREHMRSIGSKGGKARHTAPVAGQGAKDTRQSMSG